MIAVLRNSRKSSLRWGESRANDRTEQRGAAHRESPATTFRSGVCSVVNMTLAWWFSSTDTSLYISAKSVSTFFSNTLLRPGWSTSWQRPPSISARNSVGESSCRARFTVPRNMNVKCMTPAPCLKLW